MLSSSILIAYRFPQIQHEKRYRFKLKHREKALLVFFKAEGHTVRGSSAPRYSTQRCCVIASSRLYHSNIVLLRDNAGLSCDFSWNRKNPIVVSERKNLGNPQSAASQAVCFRIQGSISPKLARD